MALLTLPDELLANIIDRAHNTSVTLQTCKDLRRITYSLVMSELTLVSPSNMPRLCCTVVFKGVQTLMLNSSCFGGPVTWDYRQLAVAFPHVRHLEIACKPSDTVVLCGDQQQQKMGQLNALFFKGTESQAKGVLGAVASPPLKLAHVSLWITCDDDQAVLDMGRLPLFNTDSLSVHVSGTTGIRLSSVQAPTMLVSTNGSVDLSSPLDSPMVQKLTIQNASQMDGLAEFVDKQSCCLEHLDLGGVTCSQTLEQAVSIVQLCHQLQTLDIYVGTDATNNNNANAHWLRSLHTCTCTCTVRMAILEGDSMQLADQGDAQFVIDGLVADLLLSSGLDMLTYQFYASGILEVIV